MDVVTVTAVVGAAGAALNAFFIVRSNRRQSSIERRQRELDAQLTLHPEFVVSTAPPMPTTVAGFRPSDRRDFTMRVFGHDPQLVDDFGASMNGCGQRMWTMRWRSLNQPVRVLKAPFDFDRCRDSAACTEAGEGMAGLIMGTGCDQPVFHTAPSVPSNYLTDVSVEVQWWAASP
jgi:hypothetical protein